jgi:hypothetical protein
VVLFIAGHGFNDGPDYRFLATNAEWRVGVLRGSTVVQWQVLQAAIEGAKGRRILFIDVRPMLRCLPSMPSGVGRHPGMKGKHPGMKGNHVLRAVT